jgi:hypothetical protein
MPEKREAMEIGWMNREMLNQAIPPPYGRMDRPPRP